ncbi:unnamed protein product, partial [Ectocarpus sp. 8 AP-2014]
MSLNEGRPNHFGVFRAGVYVQEMRMLEAKILELVQQADNPREEKNAGLETTTVAAGIRNCVARLWWSRHAGENAETMTWEAFEEAFQSDVSYGCKGALTLNMIIRVQGESRRPGETPGLSSLPPLPLRPDSPRHREFLLGISEFVTGPGRDTHDKRAETKVVWSGAWVKRTCALSCQGAWKGLGSSSLRLDCACATIFRRGGFLCCFCLHCSGTPANGGGVGGGAQARSGERVVINVETGEEELQPQEEEEVDGTVTVARAGEWGALERGFSRLLSSVRREREGAGQRRGGADADGKRSGGSGGSGEEETSAAWRVTASLYEEVTWAHGGLYEAFQALADPRRVVFAMGVVDDGPHHEVGEGGEGWSGVSPVVVQGLLGLSVQQV